MKRVLTSSAKTTNALRNQKPRCVRAPSFEVPAQSSVIAAKKTQSVNEKR